jgi:hypothetical protein
LMILRYPPFGRFSSLIVDVRIYFPEGNQRKRDNGRSAVGPSCPETGPRTVGRIAVFPERPFASVSPERNDINDLAFGTSPHRTLRKLLSPAPMESEKRTTPSEFVSQGPI